MLVRLVEKYFILYLYIVVHGEIADGFSVRVAMFGKLRENSAKICVVLIYQLIQNETVFKAL